MIGRDPRAAAAAAYDLIVVGGGIYGAALALESARRGLRPLLLERGDFGGATSWQSLRIVHGGLRYLQTLDLNRFHESVGERRWLLREFPDLVHPLPCLMPLYGGGLRRPGVLRMALALNDLLSMRRNAGVQPESHLPRGRCVSAGQALEHFPFLSRAGLRGAALWYDGSMPDSQRLLIEMLHWAAACGAVALNYCEALELLRDGARVAGAAARDLESGERHEFRAPVVVNCAGPWCREVARRFDRDEPDLFRPTLAFNVLIDRAPRERIALAVTVAHADGGGTYFLHPWKGKLLVGTHHATWRDGSDRGGVDDALLRRMLEALNRALPGLDVGRDEILRVHWGLLPGREDHGSRLAVRELIRHHGDRGGPAGLFSVSGVKFTTARRVAEKTLGRITRWRGEALPPRAGTPRPEPGRWMTAAEVERDMECNPAAVAEHVRRLAREEAVVHLDDLLLRRTDWGVDPRLGRRLGTKLAPVLCWDVVRERAETERLETALV